MIQTATDEVVVPEGAELINEAFYVWETRYGLHSTMTVQGRKMLTGLKKEDVILMTEWHLSVRLMALLRIILALLVMLLLEVNSK